MGLYYLMRCQEWIWRYGISKVSGQYAGIPIARRKVRMGADLYYHASGPEFSELDEKCNLP